MPENPGAVSITTATAAIDSTTPPLNRKGWRSTTFNTNDNNLNNFHNFRSHLSEHLHFSPHLAAEITRTLVSLVCFLIVGFSCTFAIQWSDFRWKTSEHNNTLVDLGFKTIPETQHVFLADFSMLSLLVGSIAINIFLAESNVARLIIVRRIFWMLAFLVGFRMITLSVTTLPSPRQCEPIDPGSFWDMVKNGVKIIVGTVKACTDNIFSGHSIFITTSVILLRVYCRYKFIVYYSYIHGLVALSLLIATRIHYTVDVLLAIFITYAAHSIYFFIVDLCIEKHFLNIKRAEDRLGDKKLYQRIAYMPSMFNTSLVGAVRWMDGLDIRFGREGEVIRDITRERARQRRANNASDSSSGSESGEMTQVEVVVINSSQYERLR